MNRKYKLRCITCGRIYDPDDVEYTCPQCGDRFGTLEVVYDYENVRLKKSNLSKEGDIWQFLPLLPLSENCYRVPLRVGGTPLYSFRDLGKKLGLKNLLIKYDGGNPTGSYKDRATAIAIAKAYEKGYDTIYCASTGNAASSLAGLSAPSGLKTYIFLPAKAPIA
ncbi:TPA: pyridoxal-phosphate dependent enzyme, partial [Candidatus Micrarchaeota archaeon]|nr:pyridoxal-phosphate dependent enzyme [Candidatus Micrarchaeota archaeon]